jgi:hypothetical protein
MDSQITTQTAANEEMNARRLTMERQLFLDDIDSLPAEAQRQVTDLVASLKSAVSQNATTE